MRSLEAGDFHIRRPYLPFHRLPGVLLVGMVSRQQLFDLDAVDGPQQLSHDLEVEEVYRDEGDDGEIRHESRQADARRWAG